MNSPNGKLRAKSVRLIHLATIFGLWVSSAFCSFAASGTRNPHIVHLIFYLSNADSPRDAEVLTSSLHKIKSADQVTVDTQHGYLLVQFDSHAVSYHQVAQAIADAGHEAGRIYDPRLKIQVPEYAAGTNTAHVNGIFAAKRLNQHVHIEPVDKTKGVFLVHFLPLVIDPAVVGPQGFNGGHLNHPISDPPPRGLGLKFIYAARDDEFNQD